MGEALEIAWRQFQLGGWVMWPLLALSLVSLAITLERTIFWLGVHSPSRRAWVSRMSGFLRRGEIQAARGACSGDPGPYAAFVLELLDRMAESGPTGRHPNEADVHEAVEHRRAAIERFSPTLSTIVTAAPMLGILGTVTGIIESFGLLGDEAVTDPSMIAEGIAEALYTTVFGLVVAIGTLFPYVVFRGQADRALGRFEVLAAQALVLSERAAGRAEPPPADRVTPPRAPAT